MPCTTVPGIWIANRYSFGGLNTCWWTKWWSDYQTFMIPGIWLRQANKFPWSEYRTSSLFRPPLYLIWEGLFDVFFLRGNYAISIQFLNLIVWSQLKIQDSSDVPMQAGDESTLTGIPAELSTHPGKKFFPKKFAGVGKIIFRLVFVHFLNILQ